MTAGGSTDMSLGELLLLKVADEEDLAQVVAAEKLTLALNGVPLPEILTLIETQATEEAARTAGLAAGEMLWRRVETCIYDQSRQRLHVAIKLIVGDEREARPTVLQVERTIRPGAAHGELKVDDGDAWNSADAASVRPDALDIVAIVPGIHSVRRRPL